MKAFITRNIRHYVTKAYKADNPVINRWHVEAGSGLKNCIERTMSDFDQMATLKFFVVKDGGHFVGYFGVEFDGTYMPTIFVHPEYRDRKDEFWDLVSKKMGPEWKAGIYCKNIPCMRFYAKRGVKLFEIDTPCGKVAIFQFKKKESELCHLLAVQ